MAIDNISPQGFLISTFACTCLSPQDQQLELGCLEEPNSRMVLDDLIHPRTPEAPDNAPRSIVWRTAQTLYKVLRNSLLSVAFAWMFAFCCSIGNVFSGLSPDAQSFEEFLVAKMLWFHCFFCAATLSIFLTLLLTEQLAESKSTSSSPVLHWLKRLVRLTSPFFVLVGLSVVCGCVLLFQLLQEDSKPKGCMYFAHSCFYMFVGCTEAQSRYLFRTETVRGQARTLEQVKQLQRYPTLTVDRSRKSKLFSVRRFLRAIIHDLPLLVSALLATAYVHVVSAVTIVTQWDLAVFALCSISLKVVLQELAKSLLVNRKRTPNMRMMAVMVAAPTILIDTQLRTVLLCQDNASMTVVGSLCLALAEVCLRVCRAAYLQWNVHRVAARSALQTPVLVVPSAKKSVMKISQIHVAPVRRTASMNIIDPIQDRVHRLLSLHAAEVYSDMYAEYIAMGCSYGILFFFGSHPKYQLGNDVGTRPSHWASASITGLQLGLEIVVDFIACTLEIHRGIEFEYFNQEKSFLAVFMVAVALVNVHISSGIYLRP